MRRNPPPIEAAVLPYPACFSVSRSQREAARSSSIAGETKRYEDNVIDLLLDNVERIWRGESTLRN